MGKLYAGDNPLISDVPAPPRATEGGQAAAHLRLGLRLAAGRSTGAAWALGWLALGVGVVLITGQIFQGINPQDEGEMITYPWLIAQGHMPYVDFWTMYPPSTFVILAALFKAGIPGLAAERGLGLVARLICVLMINRAVTGSWRRFSWVAVLVSFNLVFLSANISLAAYAWLAGLPVLLAGLICVRAGRIGLAALAFGLAGTFRVEFAVAGMVALASLALLEWRGGDRTSGRWWPVLGLLAGTIAFYAALDLVTSGQAVREILVDPILRIEPYRRVALFPPRFGPLGVPAALSLAVGPICLVVLGLRSGRLRLAATNLAICALLPQVLQDADWSHLFGVAAIGIPWALLSFADLGRETARGAESALGPAGSDVAAKLSSFAIVWIWVTVGLFYAVFIGAYGLVVSPLSPASPQFALHGP
ncbi:MAG TPA: hypothetical protein VF221_12600, partial [Chloroflexota bacterium]